MRLLRLLESSTYRRVGGLDWLPADFRLITATHRDLRAMVQAETFRRDLYYRINTFPLSTPALHERPEDIPLLANSLLERVDSRKNRHFSPEALAWMAQRRYEGNIRELRNLIERATLMADGEQIELRHLLDDDAPPPAPCSTADGFHLDEIIPLSGLETRYLDWATRQFAGTTRELAEKLAVSERTLYRKLQAD